MPNLPKTSQNIISYSALLLIGLLNPLTMFGNYVTPSKVSDKDFEAFVTGLVFGRGGIVGATNKALMNELTISEIYDVFARFGISVDLATRSLEYKAWGSGCSFDFWSICLNETKAPFPTK